ncbi:MAG: hypothetical protein AVO38_15020 [delta proteobacterium ML8_D]|jgi:flagellar protein FliJ|nr:MAG: hypothetical protein AVO38_15020 [delta proteobacterium ML8_D]
MKNKFKFRLQNVLDLKNFKQDLLRQDLAKLNCQLAEQIRILEDYADRLDQSKIELSSELISDISSARVQFINEYMQLINSKITDQQKIINAIREVMIRKSKEYIEAKKEKEIIQKMKERKHGEHKKAVKAKAQKEADELSIYRAQAADGGVLLNGA